MVIESGRPAVIATVTLALDLLTLPKVYFVQENQWLSVVSHSCRLATFFSLFIVMHHCMI